MAVSTKDDHFSYQSVRGLQEIWIGMGDSPEATFVFENEATAIKCREAFNLYLKTLTDKKIKSNERTCDALRGANLSDKEDSLVFSLTAKIHVAGNPAKTSHQFLTRLGNIFTSFGDAKSENPKEIPIHAKDYSGYLG